MEKIFKEFPITIENEEIERINFNLDEAIQKAIEIKYSKQEYKALQLLIKQLSIKLNNSSKNNKKLFERNKKLRKTNKDLHKYIRKCDNEIERKRGTISGLYHYIDKLENDDIYYIHKKKIEEKIEYLDNQQKQWLEDRELKASDSEIIFARDFLKQLIKENCEVEYND